jgi:hypothetical protein
LGLLGGVSLLEGGPIGIEPAVGNDGGELDVVAPPSSRSTEAEALLS